jgi:DNA polymerase (family 10)
VTLVINPDAHSTSGLDDLEYGITVARRAWLTKSDVWNTGSLKTMTGRADQMRRRAR